MSLRASALFVTRRYTFANGLIRTPHRIPKNTLQQILDTGYLRSDLPKVSLSKVRTLSKQLLYI